MAPFQRANGDLVDKKVMVSVFIRIASMRSSNECKQHSIS